MPLLTIVWLRLPWERERAMRLLNILTNEKLRVLSQAESAGHNNGRVTTPSSAQHYNDIFRWRENHEWPYALRTLICVPPIDDWRGHPESQMTQDYAAMETRRRAAR